MAEVEKNDADLKREVKTFVKTKIKDVKCVDEILTMCPFKIKKSFYENDSVAYEQLYRFKKILQVTINSFNNWEMYKDLSVKFIQTRSCSYNPLDFLYQYDRNTEQWKTLCIAKENDVTEALYSYVLCFMSIVMNENNKNTEGIAGKIYIDRCSFCDQAMTPKEVRCSACEATIEDIRENIKGKESTDNNGGGVGVYIDKGSQQKHKYGMTGEHESKNTVTMTDVGYVRREEEETKRQEGNNDEWKQVNDSDKWKCGRCGSCNGYLSINCDTCGELYKEERWTCGHCTMGNSCANDACETCGKRNDNIKLIDNDMIKRDYTKQLSGNNYKAASVEGPLETVRTQEETKDDLKKSDNMDKWKCGGCGLFNEYVSIICGACEELYEKGRWTCRHCTMENNCANDACEACGKRNDNIKLIDAVVIKRLSNYQDGGNAASDKGMAAYTKQLSGDNDKSKRVEGPLEAVHIQVETKDGLKKSDNLDKWKCGGCGLFNEYTFVNCEACGGLYTDGTWTCGHCKLEISGANDACEKCGKNNHYLANKPTSRGDQNALGMQWHTGDDRALPKDGGGGYDSAKKDKETHIPDGEWKCAPCGVRQSYGHTVCELCNRSRDIYGWWMCSKCNLINKCGKERCDGCGEWNKYCYYCKKNRVPSTEVRCGECAKNQNIGWRCPYRSCNTWNNGTDEYCYKCRLWRDNSQNRGTEGKQWYQGKERKVWVCYKCDTAYELSRVYCSTFMCGNTRYAKIKCKHCQKYNDDVSDICRKCYKQLR